MSDSTFSIAVTIPRDVVLRLLQLRRGAPPPPGTMAELLHCAITDKLDGAQDIIALERGGRCRLVMTRTEAETLRTWCAAVPPTVVGATILREAAVEIAATLRRT